MSGDTKALQEHADLSQEMGLYSALPKPATIESQRKYSADQMRAALAERDARWQVRLNTALNEVEAERDFLAAQLETLRSQYAHQSAELITARSERTAVRAELEALKQSLPVAYLRSITHPDWLEVCQKDSPGAFPVWHIGTSTEGDAP